MRSRAATPACAALAVLLSVYAPATSQYVPAGITLPRQGMGPMSGMMQAAAMGGPGGYPMGGAGPGGAGPYTQPVQQMMPPMGQMLPPMGQPGMGMPGQMGAPLGTFGGGGQMHFGGVPGQQMECMPLAGAQLENCNFDGADLSYTDLSNSDIMMTSFVGANLEGAWFTASSIIGCDFSGANLNYAQFDTAQAQHYSIEAEAFAGTLFDYVSCIHTNFAGASFAGDMASNAPIFFRAADCEGASFNFATIMGSDFSGSNFKQATTLLSPYAQTGHQADNHTRLSSLTYPADELRRRGDRELVADGGPIRRLGAHARNDNRRVGVRRGHAIDRLLADGR